MNDESKLTHRTDASVGDANGRATDTKHADNMLNTGSEELFMSRTGKLENRRRTCRP